MKRSLFFIVLFSCLLLQVNARIGSDAVASQQDVNRKSLSSGLPVMSDSDFESQIALYMKNDDNQRRASLKYNPILGRIARERAYDMARRNYFSHVNPDGIGPNYLVTVAGFQLPNYYNQGKSGNNIESIAAGNDEAEQTWNQWMNSSGHRKHILGLSDFYAKQTQYGIGHAYVENSRYGHYWVVITAPSYEENEENSVGQNSSSISDGKCSGKPTQYPNVIKKANGKLSPVCGYVWESSASDDYRVKPMQGLIKGGDGRLHPANGYTWVDPDDPKDFRVKRKVCQIEN